jgi:NADH dehydrogenase
VIDDSESGFLGDSPADDADAESGTAVAEQPQPDGISKDLHVVVTGAAGLVGAHLCRQLVIGGWKVRGIVRDTAKAAARIGDLRLEIREADIRDAGAMRSALSGAGALVHLAAIAIEKAGESYQATNADATRVILDSARSSGVRRVVYMSQNGASSSSRYRFLKSKGMAEDMVVNSGLEWTVLKPSVIFGPEDEFVNVLGRLVKLTPLVFPLPGGGVARFQPIAVDDVARAVVKCLADGTTVRETYTIGGSTPLTLKEMTERILVAMNTSRALVSMPVSALRPLVAVAEKLLPRPPVTTSLLDLLALDNVVPENDLTSKLGINPIPFAPEELLYLRQITISSALRSLFNSN